MKVEINICKTGSDIEGVQFNSNQYGNPTEIMTFHCSKGYFAIIF